jgi:predicted RNA-binding Zn ribbon-like protein
MDFDWHDHHFTTGIPCLDLANTVVWRNLPPKREDRLPTRRALAVWARACRRFDGLAAGCPARQRLTGMIGIREAVDGYFRHGKGWAILINCYAEALRPGGTALEREVLKGAVALALSPLAARVKVCGHCGWLFVDRTRNQNKKWCISALCGSRTKARRHYARKRSQLAADGAVQSSSPAAAERARWSRAR